MSVKPPGPNIMPESTPAKPSKPAETSKPESDTVIADAMKHVNALKKLRADFDANTWPKGQLIITPLSALNADGSITHNIYVSVTTKP